MNLEPMWAALERYQPYAEKHGFGAEWKRMTTERTMKATSAAEDAAGAADAAAAAWAAYAAWAAVAWADYALTVARSRAELAIINITRAIEQESKKTA